MKRKTAGISAMIMFGMAVAAGLIAVMLEEVLLGIVYLLITALSGWIIIKTFCAKCPAKDDCSHVLPGRIAARFSRKAVPYTTVELTAVTVSVAFILLFPQYWLFGNPVLAGVFWLLCIGAVVPLPPCVCIRCSNSFCPLCRKGGKNEKEVVS